MFSQIFDLIEEIDDYLWTYIGIPVILFLGIYLTYKSNFFQILKLKEIFQIFKNFLFLDESGKNKRGISPIRVFFVSIGGCLGIGNIISICSAVQIGGPGALFWMWIAAFFGTLLKYSEIYLGVKFREKDNQNSYFGGPMVFLKKVPGGKFLTKIVAILLSIYGIEIYIFRVVNKSISNYWSINYSLCVFIFLILILIVGNNGLRFVGKISSIIIPLFLTIFISVGVWILIINLDKIPETIYLIFKSAFTKTAPVGGFLGASLLMTISNGIKKVCYTEDIGAGYASTIQSETTEIAPEKQASLAVVTVIIDTFIICTLTLFVILISGVWSINIPEEKILLFALGKYIPEIYLNFIWPIFVFLLGYSSIISFFIVGRRAFIFLFPKNGAKVYLFLASINYLFFSFYGKEATAINIMTITGGCLLLINLYGIIYLINEVKFNLDYK